MLLLVISVGRDWSVHSVLEFDTIKNNLRIICDIERVFWTVLFRVASLCSYFSLRVIQVLSETHLSPFLRVVLLYNFIAFSSHLLSLSSLTSFFSFLYGFTPHSPPPLALVSCLISPRLVPHEGTGTRSDYLVDRVLTKKMRGHLGNKS